MKGPGDRTVVDRIGPVPFSLLTVLLLGLAIENPAGAGVGIVVVVVALAVSVLMRITDRPWGKGTEAAPVGAALVYLTVTAPPGVLSDVLAGFAAVALLLWLADISYRSVGRLSRAFDQLIMPMAGFAIALGIAFIVPAGPLSLGLAALLLILVMTLVVLILARPAIAGRREAPSS